jgi:hypothetical protein
MTTPSGNKNVEAMMCIPVLFLLAFFLEIFFLRYLQE